MARRPSRPPLSPAKTRMVAVSVIGRYQYLRATRAPVALWRRPLGILVVHVLLVAGVLSTTHAAPPEVATTRWKFSSSDVEYRLLTHQRVPRNPAEETACDHVQWTSGQGTRLLWSCEVPPARVIDELTPQVRVRGDRGGLQVLVRVVLPRSLDPQRGVPLTTLVAGETYHHVGAWQTLSVAGLAQRLEREAWSLRIAQGNPVDIRQAYIDQVLVNVYSGPGTRHAWLADPQVQGAVAAPAAEVQLAAFNAQQAAARPPDIKFSGSVLVVDDRPLLPRVIDHRGESLAHLARLGFNAVRTHELPSAELLAEAARLRLWLIAPPPMPGHLDDPQAASKMLADFGPAYDRVLAWDLGGDLAPRDLAVVRRWAEQVRAADSRVVRPLVGWPDADLRGFSRPLNILVSRRHPLGSSLELRDYATWVRERPRLARPGTPLWTTVQTELPAALTEQQAALAGRQPLLGHVGEDQLRLLTHAAISSGVRGIHFESLRRLDADDPATRARAATLELINLQLRVLEPWLAAGSFAGTVTGSAPDVSAALLKTERAQLLLPMWQAPGAQYVPGQSAGLGVSLVAAGVPESAAAYEITPAGARALQHSRVTGGKRIVLDELGLTTAVLLTQDPLALSRVKRELLETQGRAAELAVELTGHKLSTVADLDMQMRSMGRGVRESDRWLGESRGHLTQAEGHLQRGAFQQTWDACERARRGLQVLSRAHWEQTVAGLNTPTTSAAAVSLTTLPQHLILLRDVRAVAAQPNRLPGGDFEDLSRTMRSGWQHMEHPHPGLSSGAELSPHGAHSGRSCLRLRAWTAEGQTSPGLVESPPVWATSAAVQIEPGQLLRIRGWVDVPTPITGSVDGLMVFDSLGSQALALRFGETKGWREFVLYRVAPRHEELRVTFALTGMGEARIDDVAVEVIRPLSAPSGPASPQPWQLPPGPATPTARQTRPALQ